ncbi:Nodulation protein C (N-acetylglucosaminyltransferase) [Bradyrhizobium sp. ORS 285]|uniref:chitooligosaccharide synthase NodC n=1 Tax=Bradyrhizobium sp. ORS 285 TaxID=115808 RepID=UPI00000B6B77|nr:chitooligosaccharide synthase NodC [Bradyrhizobium sp. ORS 285]AAK50872.1 nodulation protein NodC [Bradyrhizobium sp. ORS 285]CCA64468.1 Nodulation protein C (N-acetylglucosaminyltransferase) [Bradyrhizobium sp. ORS 285]CCD87682.1 Nodulation protein C (N-acetylglucosaminyltransferase) [Bradyrhizobium sp. ORS 285]SMX56614.1 Nodulation protein C (N-acetylglucosaminyltransferase) [Bradyrhizobium sp. ORS 285]
MTSVTIASTLAILSYAVVSSTYEVVQMCNSKGADQGRAKLSQCAHLETPSVDVIVPCFNEDPTILLACLESIAQQDYSGQITVYVIDDGSDNREQLSIVHSCFKLDSRFSFITLPRNVGKRKAQIQAIRRSVGELILNVDSDTVLNPDVVRELAEAMQDRAVGAAMGQLSAINRKSTWLTRLIDMEYWLACNEERSAQARFGAVMCCCGPCAMYRRSALSPLLDQYESQYFLGKPSDFGEDRHLTLLMLKAGYKTAYVSSAVANTVVPDRLVPYLRQQLRWARSTLRDTLLSIGLLPRLNPYITLDVIGQNIGPLLLLLSLLMAAAQVFWTDEAPWLTAEIIVAMTLVRCSVFAIRARQARFLAFVLHAPINIFLLVPVKAYALLTLRESDWLSRKSPCQSGVISAVASSRRNVSLE